MKYTCDLRIRFSEVDAEGFLKCDNFINYFQDCSTFQSEDLGIGVDYLRKQDLAWVVCNWQIEIIKYPRLGDKVTVGTFSYGIKSFMGYRNYFMKDESGEYIAKASSIWVLLNTSTEKMTKVDKKQIELYGAEEKLDMNYGSRKISIPDDVEALSPIEIKSYHLDPNGHVNNGQFINIALDSSTIDKRPLGIRAEYKKQGFEGNIIIPHVNGGLVDLRNPEGESYCVVEFS